MNNPSTLNDQPRAGWKFIKMPVLRNLVLLWLAWSVILIGFMNFAKMRFQPDRPDQALVWTATETTIRSIAGRDYLTDPYLNTQVAWDSEYYLSIANVGYDDPEINKIDTPSGEFSTSYAFFPFYPFVIKIVRVPLLILGLSPIATSTLAGVIVSLLGTLAGMIALYDITREELGDEGGIRTAFMMLIFPTSVFFTVVYTEGLFVGLAFGALALLQRKQFILAGILAALATWTRSIGAVLLLPLLLAWGHMYWRTRDPKLWWRLPILMLPLAAYLIWRIALGAEFHAVEEEWFGNRPFDLDLSKEAWELFLERAETVDATKTVAALQIGAVILVVLSAIVNARRYPYLVIFGLIALAVPLISGWTGTNSAFRYVLIAPSLWIMLGRWGKNPVFERSWMLFSILLLAMEAYLLSFDFWVA